MALLYVIFVKPQTRQHSKELSELLDLLRMLEDFELAYVR